MQNTGITRKIDELGRIVLPKELRKTLNIKKRRKIWDSEMDTFIYIFKNYPNAKAILEKMTEENEKS